MASGGPRARQDVDGLVASFASAFSVLSVWGKLVTKHRQGLPILKWILKCGKENVQRSSEPLDSHIYERN